MNMRGENILDIGRADLIVQRLGIFTEFEKCLALGAGVIRRDICTPIEMGVKIVRADLARSSLNRC